MDDDNGSTCLDDDNDWDVTRYKRIVKILKRYEQEDVDLVDLVA